MKYLLVALVNYIMIGAKAWQQLNVVHDNYLLVPVAGLILAAGEVFVYGSIAVTAVSEGWLAAGFLVLAMWFGGFLGTWSSMWIHKRLVRRNC